MEGVVLQIFSIITISGYFNSMYASLIQNDSHNATSVASFSAVSVGDTVSPFSVIALSDEYVPPVDQDVAIVDLIIGYSYFILTAITSVLSMFGSIIIILSYILCQELRSPGRMLLVWLSIADFLTATGNLNGIVWYIIKDGLDSKVSNILCQFHASLTIFSSISEFLWTVAIGIHLYISIVKSNSDLANRLIWIFHLICWLVPCQYVLNEFLQIYH